MLLGIAWKNIWRNKARSAILIAAIALGLLGGMIASGVSFGMGDQMIAAAIDTRLSQIQIHREGFRESQDIADTIPGAASLARRLASMGAVLAVAHRVVVTAMASSPETATGVKLMGVDPALEQRVTDLPRHIIDGSYFGGPYRNPAVIGKELARKLGLRIGSKMVCTFQNDSGALTGGAFRVAGIFRTVSSSFDGGIAFVKAEDLQRLVGAPNSWHELAVSLQPRVSVDSVAAILRANAGGLRVDTWKQLAPDLAYVSDSLSSMLYIFMVVILAALAFGIVNTMLMVVLERRRELGMLMAVGMRRSTVFGMIVLETIVLSLTGAAAGIVVTIAVMAILSRTRIDLSVLSRGMSQFGIPEILYPSLPAGMYPLLASMVVLTAIAAAIYPALKALGLRPTQALRSM